MKKSLILFTVLLLSGIGFLSVFQTSLLKEKDNVTFQDEILFGDASMADGISVDISTQYARHLFWDTTYKAGTKPSVSTDYRFYDTPKRATHEIQYGIHMNVEIDSYNFDPEKSREELKGLDIAIYDLYHDDSPSLSIGSTANEYNKVKVVNLKDYYDYYPLFMGISLENYDNFWNWNDNLYYNNTQEGTSEDYEFLKNYFRIPIIEGDSRSINMTIYHDTYSTFIDYSQNEEPYFMDSYSAVTDDALYFMFTFNRNGEAADFDTSLIPGGYGIYRIPYETLPAKNTQVRPQQNVDIKALSMVYPLDKSIQVFQFTTTEDKSKLILVYQDTETPDSCTEMAIIDAKTFETLQTIVLEGIEKPDGSTEVMVPYTLHVYEDFMAAYCSGDYLAIMSLMDNGLYHLDYIINIHENPVFDYYIDSRGITVMDMKDGQIAITGLKTKSYGDRYYNESCGFYIAVFDKDGLVYYSEHDSSLDRGQYPYHNSTVQPLSYYESEKPLAIVWE